MEILFLMLLAHFLGDYPFQTNWIIAQKMKSLSGGLYHIAALSGAFLFCLLPYLGNPIIWLSVLALMILHYAQDTAKIRLNKYIPKMLGYYGDQILHVILIYVCWRFLLNSGEGLNPTFLKSIYQNLGLALYLLGLTLTTYFLDVTVFMYSKEKILKRNYDFMARSAIIFTIVFYIFIHAV